MLVLSRKAGERIQIGDQILLTVTAVKGNRVTIGIDAPREVAIRRAELPKEHGDSLSTAQFAGIARRAG